MRRIYTYILTALALMAAISCTRQWEGDGVEDDLVIHFTAQAGVPESRTSYSTEIVDGRERIDWVAGDRISVYCSQSSGFSSASYAISSEIHAGTTSYATALVGVNPEVDVLRWNPAVDNHYFYGRYPDPAWSGAPSDALFRNQSVDSPSFICVIPATQAVTQVQGSYTFKPDMAYCYMTAYATSILGEKVTLPFTPAVSTFQITIPATEASASVSSVSLVSTSHRLNGAYSVRIGETQSFFIDEESLTDADKYVSVQFATPVTVPAESALTLTFFTCPVTVAGTEADHLSVRIQFSDGTSRETPLKSGSDWFSYAPCYKYFINVGAAPKYPNSFTVNADGSTVLFAKGNLQYIGSASTPYWKFADNQWSYLGNNGQGSAATNVDRDLFGWATSGFSGKNPWMTSENNGDYGPAIYSGEWTEDSAGWDWGVNNSISNGGGYSWRTLTIAEWQYLFNNRSCSPRYAQATVAGVPGLILFPDAYNHPSGVAAINNADGSVSGYSDNTFDASAWTSLEQVGCIFLPASGYRHGTVVYNVGVEGRYFSSTVLASNGAYSLWFFGGNVGPGGNSYRYTACSVRLVRDLPGNPPHVKFYGLSLSGTDVSGGDPYSLTIEGMGSNMVRTITLTSTVSVDGTESGAPWTAEYSSDGTSWSSTSPLSGFSVTTSGDGNISGETVTVTMPSGMEDATVYVRFSNAGKSVVLRVTRHDSGTLLFTIDSEGHRVLFAKGNLQYMGSAATPYWKFADNQWDYLGDNGQGSAATNVDRDLFGWGTGDAPNKVSEDDGDYANFTDWGTNSISNGEGYSWRTLNSEEWSYLLTYRSGYMFLKAQVHGVNGIILFPDNFSIPSGVTIGSPNTINAECSANTLTDADWSSLEQAGCVFLPAAGSRRGTVVEYVGEHGYYWSSSVDDYDDSYAYCLFFDRSEGDYSISPKNEDYLNAGFSVRLVRDI